MSNEPWFRTHFGERYLDAIRDQLLPEWTVPQVDFIERVLGLKQGERVLDLCCGGGRHAIELARRGYVLSGLDLDAVLLEAAEREADAAGVQVEWIPADMREIPPGEPFDVVLNLFTAFGYLESDEEDQKVLDAVARSLRSGGRFLLNTVNREWILRQYQARDWQRSEDGGMCLIDRQIDLQQGRNLVTETILYPDGRRKTMFHALRLYALTELQQMCTKAGLQIERVYGDFQGGEYRLDSRWMTLVAWRR